MTQRRRTNTSLDTLLGSRGRSRVVPLPRRRIHAGIVVAGDGLPVHALPLRRVRGGETTVDEGPVTDESAHIAGFNILECADLDEALEVASRNAGAGFGRPIEE